MAHRGGYNWRRHVRPRGGGSGGRGGHGFLDALTDSAASVEAAVHGTPPPAAAVTRGSIGILSDYLARLEGRPYPAYRDFIGAWAVDARVGSVLTLEHVQVCLNLISSIV